MSNDEELFRRLGRNCRAFFEGLGAGGGRSQQAVQGLQAAQPFPPAGIDGFLSHFIFSIRFEGGPLKGRPVHLTLPNAVQTVARSHPFIYRGPPQQVEVPLPKGATLSPTIREEDFPQRPAEFFEVGKEAVWLQILNLDARGETSVGPVRIILGETLKREYPDLFQPSLGVAQSLGESGFPARLFFDPTAIMESNAGSFRAVHGVLAYSRIEAFPPVGSFVQTTDLIPLHTVEELRRSALANTTPVSSATVLGLSHPITASLHVSGDEAFNLVEQGAGIAG
jgi:hypothetical protein